DKYKYIAKAMGVEGVDEMSQEEYRKAAIDAVKKLSQDVGIPADLKEIVKPEDVQFLSESAFADACRPGNPRDTSVEEIKALYESLM
ncbi:MAG: iron-containing alcohol dehydrogenase, partial [Lachnospiraceae bacterium]|nr:iron-containing alcohol dehydrogenase [Lachnospiraceae bacterium]